METPAPFFPPLLTGVSVAAHIDPFQKALADVFAEAEPGRVTWSQDTASLRAALTLTPEMPLNEALAGAAFAVLLGMNDALGALAPPEVAVHFSWPDRIKVNGAYCGGIRAAAPKIAPGDEPDWLIIGIDMPILPLQSEDPGLTPDTTNLMAEGCADLDAVRLIESWARHTLVWINRFMDDGLAPLHEGWRHKCDTLGEEVGAPLPGVFMGLDEFGGMLLRQDEDTSTIPLTVMLEGTQ